MYNKRMTVTVEQLNSGSPVELDLKITNPKNVAIPFRRRFINRIRNIDHYPQEIQVVNESGVGIEYNLFRNKAEYDEYVADPTDFAFVRVPDGAVANNDNINKPYKCIIKVYEGTAIVDLIVEFINYIQ